MRLNEGSSCLHSKPTRPAFNGRKLVHSYRARKWHRTSFQCQHCRRLQVICNASGRNGLEDDSKRVVVTGMGVVSSLGHQVDEFYSNLLEGRSGVSKIEGFDASEFSTQFAGEIKGFDSGKYITKKQARRLDNCLKYIIVAGKKALEDASIPITPEDVSPTTPHIDRSRTGILIGSAMGGMTSFSGAIEALLTQGHRKMNPFCIPFAITNMGSAMLAIETGFMGPNYSISTACATGNYCILNAAEHIRRGDADVMLAGSADAAIIPSGIGGFIACKALSKRNADAAGASRPWDKGRDGFVMGEGAGVLILESYEHAMSRNAHIYAEYVGGAFTSDAYHMTDPDPKGKGVIRCIDLALSSSQISAGDINYVNAHATSTLAGDMAEYKAITSTLPNPELRMNSTKSMIGHLLGGAGAVEAVATIKAIETGWVHPTINVNDPEAEVNPDLVCANGKQQLQVNVALSNSFGFGGHNSCILFKKMDT